MALVSVSAGPGYADWKDDIGLNALKAELGQAAPTGAGVAVAQIEALNGGGNYMPSHAGDTINNVSNISSGTSSHANVVGSRIYTNNANSAAPGVSTIDVYEAIDYLDVIPGGINVIERDENNQATQFVTTSENPGSFNVKVQNHSWVSPNGFGQSNDATNLDTLQRIDYVIDTQEVISAVGLNNGMNSAVPTFMAHAYNVIAVGRTDGGHSRGGTREITNGTETYAAGRAAADIVVPETATSWATGVVSGVSALLIETGSGIGNGVDATNTETIKAVLLAGATKEEFGGNWQRTPTAPLDPVYGTGELNVFNSYYILDAGQQDGTANAQGAVLGDYGWDYLDHNSPNSIYYDFDLANDELGVLSAVLTWNQKVEDKSFLPFSFDATTAELTNLDLKLYDSSSQFLGSLLGESISGSMGSVSDNVEHIYFEGLTAGRYTLEVSFPGLGSFGSGDTTDFGIAWRLDTEIVPTPTTAALLLGFGGTVLTRNRRRAR